MSKWTSWLVIVSTGFSIIFGGIPPLSNTSFASAPNLVANGGFESTVSVTGDTRWPGNEKVSDWTFNVFTGTTSTFTIDRTVVHEGNQSLRIDNASSNDRVNLSESIPIESGKDYSLKLWTKLDNVVTSGNGVYVRRQFFDSSNVKIGGNLSSPKTAGTKDWSQTKIDFTAPTGAVRMVVEFFLDTGTGTAWFDDISLQQTTTQTMVLDQSFVSLEMGKQVTLTPILTPSTPGNTFNWVSSDSSIATVNNGVVSGIGYGNAKITAMSTDGLFSAEAQISVETPDMMLAYDSLRQRALAKLTVQADVDSNASYVQDYISEKMKLVQNDQNTGYWQTLDKSANRSYLWSDRASTTDPYHFYYSYGRLKDMATVYVMKGSPLYHNPTLRDDLLAAMEWLYANRYNERTSEYGNWFVWEIATPQALTELMVLMYDELTQNQRNQYIRAIDAFVPDPTKRISNNNSQETGANLLNKAYNVALRGILGASSAKIKQGLAPVGSEYKLVTSGDGVYEDGSIIQHFNVAYTGGYGQSFVNQAEAFLYLFHDSPWEMNDPNMQSVFDLVGKAFEPVIYNGHLMQMVNGRQVASEGNGSAKALILSILQLAETAPAEKAMDIKRRVKAWILADKVNTYTTGVTVYQRTLIEKLMNDDTITPREELVKHQLFPNMDRAVHLRPGWGLGISMFSDRVSDFEYGNKENSKGWFTGVGMTYLYNADQTQYMNNYWPTVDSFRLPGTTTDRSGEGQTPGEWASYMNPKTWVGGSSMDGLYGATGMDFSMSGATGSSLTGKKSWFSFDDEVVALGSGISDSADQEVETIIENRLLNTTGSNTLTVDGVTKSNALGWSESMNAVHWAHLAGNVPGSDIGYYFPATSNVYALREERTGSYHDINQNTGSNTQYTRNFLSLAFEHGSKPSNASYAYVLLPNKDSMATANYSSNPDVEIMSNSTDVHAVREKKLGITAANFWNPSTADFITAHNPASVMVKETQDTMSVSIADPTQKQQQVVIDLGKSAKEIVQADPSIQIVQTEPTIKLIVDTNGAYGRTFNAVFRTKASSNNASLSALSLSGISLDQTVSSRVYAYTANVANSVSVTTVTYSTADHNATAVLQRNGVPVANPIYLNEGSNVIRLVITAQDGTEQSYTAHVYRAYSSSSSGSTGTNTSAPQPTTEPAQPTTETETTASPPIYTDKVSAAQMISFLKDRIAQAKSGPPPVNLIDLTNHWSKDSVTLFVKLGIVNGYEDGSFQPDASISRAEFATIVAKAFHINGSPNLASISDVNNHWAKASILALASMGIIDGYEDGTFKPDKTITRAEIIAIISRIVDLQAVKKESGSFSDIQGSWNGAQIQAAADAGLIEGRDTNIFAPEAPSSRAESLTIVLRALELMPDIKLLLDQLIN
ncbi:polysaccharide lyase family 8 super-sandwich domain-containing protein [Paenibacillus oryzisoli]|uniref:polysaccharide lyase family 8 super-sandwich domain-containing protein n=1 Tax=Paenibacillus oryzisoli TaxID=1850517 RepID=UPI003D2907FD